MLNEQHAIRGFHRNRKFRQSRVPKSKVELHCAPLSATTPYSVLSDDSAAYGRVRALTLPESYVRRGADRRFLTFGRAGPLFSGALQNAAMIDRGWSRWRYSVLAQVSDVPGV